MNIVKAITDSEFPEAGIEADTRFLPAEQPVINLIGRPQAAAGLPHIDLAHITITTIDEFQCAAIGIELQIFRATAFAFYEDIARFDVGAFIVNLRALQGGDAQESVSIGLYMLHLIAVTQPDRHIGGAVVCDLEIGLGEASAENQQGKDGHKD